DQKVDELFPLTIQNPCQETITFAFHSYDSYEDTEFHSYDSYEDAEFNYMFFANGSLYLPYFMLFVDLFVESASYCLAIVDHNQFDAFICLEAVSEMMKRIDKRKNLNEKFKILIFLFWSSRIVSVLCLLTTFVVYSMLPKLRNIHSFMLRKYCSLLF
ncbi:hypothetical protein EAG_09686, partial [Camponotus floridanus]